MAKLPELVRQRVKRGGGGLGLTAMREIVIIALASYGLADWVNEDNAMIKVISFFASWHCGAWCARLSRLFGDIQLYSFS